MTISGSGCAALYAAMNAALDAAFLVSYAMRFAFCSGVSLYSCLGATAALVRGLALLLSVCTGIVCLFVCVSCLLSHPILAKSISISFSNSVK